MLARQVSRLYSTSVHVFLKCVLGYRSHDIPCASFQLLKIVVFFYLENAARNRLGHTTPDGWIRKGETISWLPRSPDGTPLNFFVLGCAKTLVGSLGEVDRLEEVGLDGRIVPFYPSRLRRCVFRRHSCLSFFLSMSLSFGLYIICGYHFTLC